MARPATVEEYLAQLPEGTRAKHVSLYPAPDADDLQADLAPYLAGSGTLKFPLGRPIPHDLIRRVIRSLSDDSR